MEPQRQVIQSYGDRGFKISGLDHAGSVIVTAQKTQSWNLASIHEIDVKEFCTKLECLGKLNVLLLGTGNSILAPNANLSANLQSLGISLEIMDTGAACRTFNVLVAEERLIAAALIST